MREEKKNQSSWNVFSFSLHEPILWSYNELTLHWQAKEKKWGDVVALFEGWFVGGATRGIWSCNEIDKIINCNNNNEQIKLFLSVQRWQ